MTISVLIPTYRRPQDLRRCLTALETQTRMAEEVLVVVRDTDEETHCFLAEFSHSLRCLRIVTVNKPGVVAAMSRGLNAVTKEIVALLDDDAAPWPDWLARIEAHFASGLNIGGLGGRDWVYSDGKLEDGAREIVGKVQWYGRVIGNHHIGVGPARDVDVLKGVNCAYRAALLRQTGFEPRLHGEGAQVHWELALGLSMKSAGWRLVYDPAVSVNHYPAKRFDVDQRGRFDKEAHENAVYNESLVLWEHLGLRERLYVSVWSLLIGTQVSPGLVQVIRLLLTGQGNVMVRFKATQLGRMNGWRTAVKSKKIKCTD